MLNHASSKGSYYQITKLCAVGDARLRREPFELAFELFDAFRARFLP